VHTDLATKERLWTGVFDYDLNLFAPGGPSSPEVAFMSVVPTRALWLGAYGMAGTERWSA
ncbi:MAG: pyridoxamine 5'-phosphate oxidase family protein, partial [Actinomycetota bacterium]